jgi:hypothetical protein
MFARASASGHHERPRGAVLLDRAEERLQVEPRQDHEGAPARSPPWRITQAVDVEERQDRNDDVFPFQRKSGRALQEVGHEVAW